MGLWLDCYQLGYLGFHIVSAGYFSGVPVWAPNFTLALGNMGLPRCSRLHRHVSTMLARSNGQGTTTLATLGFNVDG